MCLAGKRLIAAAFLTSQGRKHAEREIGRCRVTTYCYYRFTGVECVLKSGPFVYQMQLKLGETEP